MQQLLTDMLSYVVGSLVHNGIYLAIGIIIASVLTVYVKPEKFKKTLMQKANVSITSSVAFGAFTPLCACGTMAVIIAMLSTTLPLGPIMAFLTSSPLMSPDSFVLIAGIINLNFAIALTLASLIIGAGSGYITHLIEKKTDFLKDQIRFSKKQEVSSCGCSNEPDVEPEIQTCGCSVTNYIPLEICCSNQTFSEAAIENNNNQFPLFLSNSFEPVDNIVVKLSVFAKNIKWRELTQAFVNIGIKQILLYYSLFVAIGFLLNSFIPSSVIVALFSSKNIFAVPLAALIGLPIYVNGESAIPLINTLMAGGASGGAMLAFLITGPGTSAGVVAGIATILKKRAILLYVLFILVSGILLGYLYDMILALGI